MFVLLQILDNYNSLAVLQPSKNDLALEWWQALHPHSWHQRNKLSGLFTGRLACHGEMPEMALTVPEIPSQYPKSLASQAGLLEDSFEKSSLLSHLCAVRGGVSGAQLARSLSMSGHDAVNLDISRLDGEIQDHGGDNMSLPNLESHQNTHTECLDSHGPVKSYQIQTRKCSKSLQAVMICDIYIHI